MELEPHQNVSCGNLGIDQACFILNSHIHNEVMFKYQSLECDKCSLIDAKVLKPHHSEKVIFNIVSLGTTWEVVNTENNETLCSSSSNYLGENSEYNLFINETGCILDLQKEPEHVYTPIFIALSTYILLIIAWLIVNYLKRNDIFKNLFRRDSLDDLAAAYSVNSSIEDKKEKQNRQRLRSLDTVRGIAIVLMIFVNYGGGKYWFFHHAHWNGLTFADLVFPWFIWMMGMSMALSMRSQLRKGDSRKIMFYRIVKRSIILFSLGIMLNTYCRVINLQELRIPGVLQRFGISYFVVATVHLFFATAEDVPIISYWQDSFRDLIPYWGEWIIMLSFLCLHILLTFLLPVPNCSLGYLGPGGMHDEGKHFLCTGGAAGYIDKVILGESHIYQRPSSKPIYRSSVPYDPEGILGNLTSIFLVYLGLQAGKILLTYKEWKPRVIRWMTWACITGSIAAILCSCSKNNGWIPVNKNLWSVSFILATGSLAFVLISLCYFIIDVKKIWSGAPFYYSGMNSIMLYIGHSLTHQMFPWKWEVGQTHMDQLFVDLWGTTLWVIISIWMYYKDIFITI